MEAGCHGGNPEGGGLGVGGPVQKEEVDNCGRSSGGAINDLATDLSVMVKKRKKSNSTLRHLATGY